MHTLIDVVRGFSRHPSSHGITFYPDAIDEPQLSSYEELLGLIGASMEEFRAQGVKQGTKVIFPFETDRHVLISFFALLGLGALPFSVRPYLFGADRTHYNEYLRTLAKKYEASYLLETPSLKDIEPILAQLTLPQPSRGSPIIDFVDRTSEDLAFVQFSSGSTSFPKGIPVHHGRAVRNLQYLVNLDGRNITDPGSSWLPLFHDMGLIGLLSSAMVGTHVHLHSPSQFLMDPVGWLHNVSQTRTTIFVTPNFGIDYALRRIRTADEDELVGLDLQTVDWIYIGSEPINMKTLDEFCERLEPFGLQRNAFKPCYGMAEAVLVVSCTERDGGPKQRTLDSGAPLIGVGPVLPGYQVAIVDEDGAPVADGELGQIMLQGGTLAKQYYESPLTIGGEREFYATGDLGCLYKGEIYIGGRMGDRLKVNGQSYFASALEQIVETLPFVRSGRVAVLQPEELIIVLVELSHLSAVIAAETSRRQICARILDQTGVKVAPENILYLRHGQLKKTSSGKLRRRAMAEALSTGKLIQTNALRHALDKSRDVARKLWLKWTFTAKAI